VLHKCQRNSTHRLTRLRHNELDDWKLRDEEATAQIEFTIKDDPLQTILDATSAKDAWDRLCDRYEGKGKKRLVRLCDKVFHTKFTDTEPLETQMNDLLADIRNINELKKTFDDEVTAIALINALPSSLDTLQTILGNAATLVSADVKSQIIEDEQRRIGRSGSDATAFFAKARNDARKGRQQNKPRGDQLDKSKVDKSRQHCSHCDIDGHDVADCRKLKREKAKTDSATKTSDVKEQSTKTKATAKVALADNSSDDDSDSGSSVRSLRKVRALVARITPSVLALQAAQDRPTDLDLDSAWILDSGASRTMTRHRHWFSHFTPRLRSPTTIALGDNSTIEGTGVGRVIADVQVNGSWQRTVIQNVLYVPELHGNLLSVAHLTRRGYDVLFSESGCKIYDTENDLVCEGSRHSDLYVLPVRVKGPHSARVAITQVPSFPSEGDENLALAATALTAHGTCKADAHLWHRRLAHLDYDSVLKMVRRGMVRGMEITGGNVQPASCEPCLTGKQTRSEILRHTENRSDVVLGRVFSDVCGKLPTRSHSGYEYFATFVDDKSRKVFVVGLKHKSDVARNLKDFIARAETETGKRVKVLRSDGGGEYTGNLLTEYLKGKGIKQELTTPDTPQHNGVAERMNRTLLDKVRAMLSDADLPEVYWFEALAYAAHLHNVSPTRALDDMTPEEAWSGNKPDVSHLRVFGSKAFVHVPDVQRSKLGAKSLICTFLGQAENRKAFRLVHRPTRRFLESRDVVFDEGTHYYQRVTFERSTASSITNIPPPPKPQTLARLQITLRQVQQPKQPSPPFLPQYLPPLPALNAKRALPLATMIPATASPPMGRASALENTPVLRRSAPPATRAHTRKPWRAPTPLNGNSPATTRSARSSTWASTKSCRAHTTVRLSAANGSSG
jgi:transposase InsO family protein